MKQAPWVIVAAVLICSVTIAAQAAAATEQHAQHSDLWRHGEYLVKRAAICSDCHTPRDRHGQLIEGKALQGAPIGMKPIHPVPGWQDKAPAIAGLPEGWNYAQTVRFLKTGLTPDGNRAGAPMPEFRFNTEDARAIATYLRSLPPPAARN